MSFHAGSSFTCDEAPIIPIAVAIVLFLCALYDCSERIDTTVHLERIGGDSFQSSRTSSAHVTLGAAVSKMRRKNACASCVKSSAPSIHTNKRSLDRTCWCRISRPSLKLRSVRAFQRKSLALASAASSFTHRVFPVPGSPLISSAPFQACFAAIPSENGAEEFRPPKSSCGAYGCGYAPYGYARARKMFCSAAAPRRPVIHQQPL